MATIRKRGNKWEVQIRRKGHKPFSKSFSKWVQADKWAREQEGTIDDGAYQDTRAAARTRLTDLLDLYLKQITPTKEETSHVPEKARIGTLKRHFESVTLAELSVPMILEFVDDRLEEVGSDAIRKELQILSECVDSAMVLWGLHIVANPVPNAKRVLRKLRKLKPGNKRERRLLVGEYEKIRDAEHTRFTVINRLALFDIETGLRRSEISRARREYVDIARRIMYVPKSKSDWKTGKKGRVVPLSPLAIEIYQSLPSRIDGFIFGIKPRAITQAFERICESQGIKDLRFHDLRHEAISRLFEKGLKVEEVASISGHEDWKSLKRYTHPDPEKLALRL